MADSKRLNERGFVDRVSNGSSQCLIEGERK
jgi:hypothetical protein